jgi:hypothetical protein
MEYQNIKWIQYARVGSKMQTKNAGFPNKVSHLGFPDGHKLAIMDDGK